MMDEKLVRKSWREERRLERALAALPSAQRAARLLLGDAGLLVEPQESVAVDVTAEDYELWLAVQLVYARQGNPDSDPRPRTLKAAFGADAGKASEMYLRVERKLQTAEKRTGKPAYPTPPSGDAAQRLLPRARMTHPQIVEYSAKRAVALGFSPWAIWAKSQGKRSRASDAEKDARARIVMELRDLGATLPDIGGVFGGRRKESVLELERRGRQRQEEQNDA